MKIEEAKTLLKLCGNGIQKGRNSITAYRNGCNLALGKISLLAVEDTVEDILIELSKT